MRLAEARREPSLETEGEVWTVDGTVERLLSHEEKPVSITGHMVMNHAADASKAG